MQPSMTATKPKQDVVQYTALSDYLALLALLLQFPQQDLETGLASGALYEDLRTISEEAGFTAEIATPIFDKIRVASESLQKDPDTFKAIRREYTRLFNHPDHPAIPIYEGMFLDRERICEGKPSSGARLFINPAALDAERCYRSANLKKSSSVNIPADCITTELEYLSHLYTEKARAISEDDDDLLNRTDVLLQEFKRIHVEKWFARFFQRCTEESRCDLYTAVGALGTMVFDPASKTRI